jgi:glycosyltransferase involved in cell wall biosynthesis
MRLLVISSYWPRPTDVHRAFFEVDQVRAFAALGHQIVVLIQAAPWRWRSVFLGQVDLDLDPAQVLLKQIVMPRLPEPVARSPAGTRINILLAGYRMRQYLAKEESTSGPFDAVIVHGERNVGLAVGIWNTGRRRRVAMIVHGSDPVIEALPQDFLQCHLAPSANAGLSRVILVGNRLRQYANRIGYDPALVAVVPNGFTHPGPIYDLLAEQDGPVRLSTVARLIGLKGIDDALQALALLRAARPELDWIFDIFGEGPDRRALELLKCKLGLQDRVHFHGEVSHNDVLLNLAKSTIFVLPSWNEAFGLVYLEAMSLGNTVVGCLGNGAADIITDGVDGFLIPPRDIAALAAVLEKSIEDPALRARIADAALDSVRRFSWPTNARAVLEVL